MMLFAPSQELEVLRNTPQRAVHLPQGRGRAPASHPVAGLHEQVSPVAPPCCKPALWRSGMVVIDSRPSARGRGKWLVSVVVGTLDDVWKEICARNGARLPSCQIE